MTIMPCDLYISHPFKRGIAGGLLGKVLCEIGSETRALYTDEREFHLDAFMLNTATSCIQNAAALHGYLNKKGCM